MPLIIFFIEIFEYNLNFIYIEFSKYGKEHFISVSGIYLKNKKKILKYFFSFFKFTMKQN